MGARFKEDRVLFCLGVGIAGRISEAESGLPGGSREP